MPSSKAYSCKLLVTSAIALAVVAPLAALASPPTVVGLYSFTGGVDGGMPLGGLTTAGGYLWGTACSGGIGFGTVFRSNVPGSVQTVHIFAGAPNDGDCPNADLLLRNSVLSGTTVNGGSNDTGTIFSIDMANGNSFTQNYQFMGGTDGGAPVGKLQYASNYLWGVTKGGGLGYGTIYRLSSANVEQQLFQFVGSQGPKQGLPYVGLTKRGNYFYGTTNKIPNGTVYRIATDSPFIESLVYTFAGLPNDGKLSSGTLLKVGTDLYGTTEGGGSGCGVVYKLDSNNVETIIYSFQGVNDGCGPAGDLVYTNGKIYGTTRSGGGQNGNGTVFEVDPSLHIETGSTPFTGGADGSGPASGLVKIGAHMYGTAQYGGSGHGTIFQVN